MTNYSLIFDTLLQNFNHSTSAYDKPSILQSQQFAIDFSTTFPKAKRDIRLKIVSDLVGRTVLTTKDLKLGEIRTLTKMLDNPQFVRETCAEYGIPMKEEWAS